MQDKFTFAIWQSKGGKYRFTLFEHRDTSPYTYSYSETGGGGNFGYMPLDVVLARCDELLSYFPSKMHRL